MSVQIVDGNLLIDGLTGNNNVSVNTIDPANVVVTINGVNQGGPFDLSGGGRVIIDAGGSSGNNYMQLIGSVDGEFHGGSGNDTVYGGSGDDVVFGGAGNNMVSTGQGNNVVIAGAGRNTVQSAGGFSILVGGEITNGAIDPDSGNPIASWEFLHDIALGEWLTGDDTGVVTIQGACISKTGGLSGFDVLSGGNNATAFIAHISGSGIHDTLTNFNAGKGDIKLNI